MCKYNLNLTKNFYLIFFRLINVHFKGTTVYTFT